MQVRLLLLLILCVTAGCGGGDKHLPSSNPPEYDQKKLYSSPSVTQPQSVLQPTKAAEPEQPPIELPSLEPGPNEKGQWKKVPVTPESLQLFKGVKNPCEALSKIVQGLGSTQLFAGADGQAFKKLLGTQAESIARSLDQQLFDNFKAQLGSNAADCPSPAPARKSSGLEEFFPPGRMVRTNGLSNGSFQLAQASAVPVPEDDYIETKSESTQEAPPGWVGRKTTSRTTRIGNKRKPAGNTRSIVVILGGKVLKCPTPDGVVAGDFEYAVVVDQTIVESGFTRMVHIGLRASAALKGQVGDDAKVQYVEGDLSTVAERNGTDVPTSLRRRRSQFRFTLSRDEFHPGFPTNITPISGTSWDIEGATQQEDGFASSAAGAVMFWGGQTYVEAQEEWHKPNACVEIVFTPATKTHKLGPNESVPVKTELRTKKEQALVLAKFTEATERPMKGNGHVSPREAESQLGAPATFTYKAPGNRVKHSGFFVGAVSRAGVAAAKDGEWEVVMDATYVLEFQSRIVSTGKVDPAQSQASAVIPLVNSEEVSPSGETKYIGQGMIGYQTGPLPNWNACDPLVEGKGTVPIRVFQAFIHIEEPPGESSVSSGGSAKIELLYGILGMSQETSTGMHYMLNFKCVPNQPMLDPFWSPRYISGRGEVSTDPMKMFLLKDWTYVGRDGVVATKTLRSTCGGMCDQEVATFTLKERGSSSLHP
jgi:hypothetical protein